jgi:hypothetical protein
MRSTALWLKALIVPILLLASSSQSAERARSADDSYLDALVGHWDMRGTLGGKAVRYHAQAARLLQGGWVRLHMIDAATPPQYEASLYLGYDAKAGDFVGHWLDRFGAAGARVVATGHRDDERLVLLFPYADGAFRDTFTRQPGAGAWTLLIESQNADASWATFATYELKRVTN